MRATRSAAWPPREAALVALLALLPFALGLPNELVGDDHALVERRLETPLLSLLRQSYWNEGDGLYRPATMALLAAERSVAGLSPVLYHGIGVLMHAATSLLALVLLRRLLQTRAAFAAAALFAVHPVHAEAVLTVAGQAELLAALGVLGGLCLHAGSYEPSAPRHARVGSWLCFLVALAAKESAVVLPALACVLRGLFLAPERRGVGRWVSRREAWLLVPLGLYALVRVSVLGAALVPAAASVSHGLGLAARAQLVVVALAHAARLSTFPWGQCLDYVHLRDRIAGVPIAEIGWLVCAGAALQVIARRVRPPAVRLGVLWFLVAYAPVSHLVPIGTPLGERTLYLPSLGAAIVVGGAIDALLVRRPVAWARVACVAVVACGIAASMRVAVQWRTEVSAWESMVVAHPLNHRIRIDLGFALLREATAREGAEGGDRVRRAERAFREALALVPDHPEARRGLEAAALARSRSRE